MLSLSHLRKSFGQLVAVDDLSLEIREGEVFGLLGPNGAGKSTTISMAVGLLRPESGAVSIAGRGSPEDAAVRALVGLAPQALALYEELTGTENMSFFGELNGLGGERLRGRVRQSLEFVGLLDRAGDRVHTYSGGMKRRLNMAVALVHEPRLLVLDEPTVGVDPQSRNAIIDNILALKREGRTVIYTTHYMEEAQRLCDRVAIMDRGRVLALDTVEALVAAHGGNSVVVAGRVDGSETRVETADPPGELGRLLAAGGVTTVRIERPSLETVFLNLTGRSLRDE